MTDLTGPELEPRISQQTVTEVVHDLTVVHDDLRNALPTILRAASREPGWPDALLLDVALTSAEAIGRLEAARGLLEDDG